MHDRQKEHFGHHAVQHVRTLGAGGDGQRCELEHALSTQQLELARPVERRAAVNIHALHIAHRAGPRLGAAEGVNVICACVYVMGEMIACVHVCMYECEM